MASPSPAPEPSPQSPLFKYAGVFAPPQSRCTSNWREAKTLVLALQIINKQRQGFLKDAFVIFRSDNTSAVALVNKGISRSLPLRAIGQELLDLATKTNYDGLGNAGK
jgi:hypothetical protein